MNKEIVKKNLGNVSTPAQKKPTKKPLNWKGIAKALMFLIFVAESTKSLVIAAMNGQKISSMAFELSGSIVITLIYLLLGLCVDESSTAKLKGFRELLLLVSMVLFLFSVQKAYITGHDDEEDFFASSVSFISVSGTLAAFIIIQDLLKISAFAKVATVSFFFLFMCLNAISRPGLNRISTYINTLFPLVYILALLFVQNKITLSNPDSTSVYRSHQTPSLIDFVQESIFTYDKKGNLELRNKFFVKDQDENQDPSDIFSRIKDAMFVSEEKLQNKDTSKKEHSDDNYNYSPKVMSDMSSIDVHSKSKEMKHIVVNFDDDSISSPRTNLSPNLDTIVKSLYLSVMRKEIEGDKMLLYQGSFFDRKKKNYVIEIRIYIVPKSFCPIVVVLKDISTNSQLEEQTAAEKCREMMLANLARQMNSVMENSKKLLEKSLNNVRKISSIEETKASFIASAQELLTPIVVSIGDIMDFCSIRKSALKFTYASCDLTKAIHKSMKLFQFEAQAKNTKFIFDAENDSTSKFSICTDEKRLIQLLMRIISNSIKNTKDGTIKIALQAYTNTFKITVEDTGCGMSPILLEQIKEELKIYQCDSIKLLHSKAGKSQGLPIAQMISLGLGPKSLAGLNFQSNESTGTSVWFFIENKACQNEAMKGIDVPSPTFSQYLQKYAHSPRRPSKFKMTSDYDAQDLSSSFGEVNESVEVNAVNLGELTLAKRPSDSTSPSARKNLILALQKSPRLTEGKKSKFAQSPSRDDN